MWSIKPRSIYFLLSKIYRSSFTRYFYKYYNREDLTVEHDISLGYADYLQ